jgi:hypothetical protein
MPKLWGWIKDATFSDAVNSTDGKMIAYWSYSKGLSSAFLALFMFCLYF